MRNGRLKEVAKYVTVSFRHRIDQLSKQLRDEIDAAFAGLPGFVTFDHREVLVFHCLGGQRTGAGGEKVLEGGTSTDAGTLADFFQLPEEWLGFAVGEGFMSQNVVRVTFRKACQSWQALEKLRQCGRWKRLHLLHPDFRSVCSMVV